jgi:hypothetical protein
MPDFNKTITVGNAFLLDREKTGKKVLTKIIDQSIIAIIQKKLEMVYA